MHVISSALVQQNCDAIPQGSSSHDIQQQLKNYKSFDLEDHLNSFQLGDGLIYYKRSLYVSSGSPCLEVLLNTQDLPFIDHNGFK
jgi:hypothetical protein